MSGDETNEETGDPKPTNVSSACKTKKARTKKSLAKRVILKVWMRLEPPTEMTWVA
jgi:hypothetical protein